MNTTTRLPVRTLKQNIAEVLGEGMYARLPPRKKKLLEVLVTYFFENTPHAVNTITNVRQILKLYKPPTTSPGHQLTSNEEGIKSKIKKYLKSFTGKPVGNSQVNYIYNLFTEKQKKENTTSEKRPAKYKGLRSSDSRVSPATINSLMKKDQEEVKLGSTSTSQQQQRAVKQSIQTAQRKKRSSVPHSGTARLTMPQEGVGGVPGKPFTLKSRSSSQR
jgi:hypothetical protein